MAGRRWISFAGVEIIQVDDPQAPAQEQGLVNWRSQGPKGGATARCTSQQAAGRAAATSNEIGGQRTGPKERESSTWSSPCRGG
jgi:hypothetical protein